jgi:hypothetical protein
MKNAGDKSLSCVCLERSALAGLLACIGLATLAIGCGVEPTPEEEAADRAALLTQEATVPAALDSVKPPRIPIVWPSIPSPPSATPWPSPLPILGPREAHAPTACPSVREPRGGIVLVRGYGAPSRAPHAPCDPPELLDSRDGQPREE